jgi:hypothetical protein
LGRSGNTLIPKEETFQISPSSSSGSSSSTINPGNFGLQSPPTCKSEGLTVVPPLSPDPKK